MRCLKYFWKAVTFEAHIWISKSLKLHFFIAPQTPYKSKNRQLAQNIRRTKDNYATIEPTRKQLLRRKITQGKRCIASNRYTIQNPLWPLKIISPKSFYLGKEDKIRGQYVQELESSLLIYQKPWQKEGVYLQKFGRLCSRRRRNICQKRWPWLGHFLESEWQKWVTVFLPIQAAEVLPLRDLYSCTKKKLTPS